MELKTGYCPICDETIKVYSDDSMCNCPICGHHIALHKSNTVVPNNREKKMKIFVDEMPLTEYDCPFSKEWESRVWDSTMKYRHSVMMYECSVTKENCDLNCGACSGLKVLEKEKE